MFSPAIYRGVIFHVLRGFIFLRKVVNGTS